MGRNHIIYPRYDIHLGKVYDGMIDRCYKPHNCNYKSYGAKGVIVCEEWRNNRGAFYAWAFANGWKKGLQIDKDIKGDGKLYSPETCSIVTREENMKHKKKQVMPKTRMFEFKGEIRYLNDICLEVGINPGTILSRIRSGYSFEEAISTPVMGLKRTGKSTLFFVINGKKKSLSDWCIESGIKYGTAISHVLREGCNIHQALRPLRTKKEDY